MDKVYDHTEEVIQLVSNKVKIHAQVLVSKIISS